eukprot:TRINITY_DN1039_c0_g1_i4.p1 TRINITY_DN1039_c0_g1~~TRINITY_DN1039_c0_g1_i4.p1  ORF type:complete len:125 (+),score=29.01 TRINITY_DN1039_c0_g1_i4:146-520(+)
MSFPEGIEDWCECVRQVLRHHAQSWQSVMDSTSSHTLLAGEQGFGPGEENPFGTLPQQHMSSTSAMTTALVALLMLMLVWALFNNRRRDQHNQDDTDVGKNKPPSGSGGSGHRGGGRGGDDLIS